ncbi:single-stranded DNA-binding protein [Lactobacillus sp. ESL0233]|uniref:single-stranded DNA-binding protein n=1 Tax=Lactobacillus sp. ESL0233 TaxID=2069354 RepID=UPI000EFC44F8|nr:single-stranded DNA-binding protein [Lactobacillus sp. ESL0233]RMC41720.1 single-stranded DNA-binding protein [Lactobacillus sp. ESL0233]
MSLMDAMNELKKNGFDPKEGKEFNPNEPIPDDTYLMTLDGASHSVKNDHDFLIINFSVVEGEYEGRRESYFPSLRQTKNDGTPISPNFIARTISQIQILGEAVDNPIPDSCFDFDIETEAYDAIADKLQGALGRLLKVTITTSPNKKNPQYPYRNYKFEKHEQPKVADAKDPFNGTGNTVDISDDDLPFD